MEYDDGQESKLFDLCTGKGNSPEGVDNKDQ
jgi:hypothetical protein